MNFSPDSSLKISSVIVIVSYYAINTLTHSINFPFRNEQSYLLLTHVDQTTSSDEFRETYARPALEA